MKGLLLKDLLNLKKSLKTMLFLCVFYALFAYYVDNPAFLTGMVTIVFTMLSITSFSYDSMAKWDAFSLSLPVTREEIVLSKYLLAALLSLAGGVISLILSLAVSLVGNRPVDTEQLLTVGGILFAALLFSAVLLPLVFRFGVEKSRIMIFGIVFIPFAVGMILNALGLPLPDEKQVAGLLYSLPFLCLAAFFVSFLISCRIFKNKEL